jgi:phosphatidate cytidylyltransferase
VLRWRLLLGALLIAALAGLCWLDGTNALGAPAGLWLFPLALVLSLAASGEMLWMLAARDLRPIPWLLYLGNFSIVASNGIPLYWPNYPADCPLGLWGWPLVAFTLATLAAFVGEMVRYREPGRSVITLGATILSFAYVGLLLSFLIHLRLVISPEWGIVALVSLIAIVKSGDTGAYTVGRLVGRHKMTPRLSPGKTWEGAAGHLAAGALAAWVIRHYWVGSQTWSDPPQGTLADWLGYGVLVAAAGLVGDLAESLIKRDLGRKDSSAWMPGFGGVLDVLDSIMFAAPIAYLAWIAGLVP